MVEKTNQELYDKMIEGFNLILAETQKVNKRTYDIFDLMEPTYGNVRNIIDMLDNVTSKISSIENKIRSMESQISEIQKKVR
jgi:hypothetical protein